MALIRTFVASHHRTYLYNFAPPPPNPIIPHFYLVKLRFTLFFLFLLKNIDCGYSLEPPQRGGSNEYPQSMFWAGVWKISECLPENFKYSVVKLSIYLNRRVFVLICKWGTLCEDAFEILSNSKAEKLSRTMYAHQIPYRTTGAWWESILLHNLN